MMIKSKWLGLILGGILCAFLSRQVEGQANTQQAQPPGDASKQREQVAPGVTGTRPPTDQLYATEPPGTKGYTNYFDNLQIENTNFTLRDQVLSDPSSPYELVIPPTDQNYKSLSFFTGLTAEIMHSGEVGEAVGGTTKGVRKAFTNYFEVRMRGASSTTITTATGQPPGVSPCQVAAAYGLQEAPQGCNWSNVPPSKGLLAIVGGFYNKTLAQDLAKFSQAFGLPDCSTGTGCLEILELPGDTSSAIEQERCHWVQETTIDLEWAHAMAPNSKLLVVEAANDNDWGSLLAAAATAGQRVSAAGGGEVSISWTTNGEYPTELADDHNFSANQVVFVVGSGDTGGKVNYPASSPSVIGVGGTVLTLNSSGGFVSEQGWTGSDGGPSAYEPVPPYQKGELNADTLHRSVPDVSAVAAILPIWLTDTCSGETPGWRALAGTSFSAPIVAGMIHSAGRLAPNSSAELINIYKNRNDKNKFRDITQGSSSKYPTLPGYDFVTGIGVPLDQLFDQ